MSEIEQTMPQNLALLYQGMNRGTREPNYVLLPYRLALLRAAGLHIKLQPTSPESFDGPPENPSSYK